MFLQTISSVDMQTVDNQISNYVFKQKRDCKTNGEMRKCKKKKPFRQIQTYSCIFRHIQTYPDIIRHIQAYSEPCVTLAYSKTLIYSESGIFKTRVMFRTPVYPKLWHIQNQRYIQNPRLLRTLGYAVPETYSEPCQTSTMERFEKQLTAMIIFASYNYFRNISSLCPLVYEINIIFLINV